MPSVFPVPVETPISDESKHSGIRFGMIWMRFFKALSDDLLAATVVNNSATSTVTAPALTEIQRAAAARAFKWVLNGNVCLVTYDNTTSPALTVQLPFTALLAFDVDGVRYPAGTKSIEIKAGTSYIQFWYIVQAAKQGA